MIPLISALPSCTLATGMQIIVFRKKIGLVKKILFNLIFQLKQLTLFFFFEKKYFHTFVDNIVG